MSQKHSFSFEFFPPQTAEGMEKLTATRKQLAMLKPEFFSVTFGAGGSTQERTLETVLQIKAEGFDAAPHLSCVGSTRDNIRALLQTLGYREREIINLRFGLGDGYNYTLEEVASIFTVTRERIRQIEDRALRKLQEPSRSAELVGFLD